MTIQNFTKIIMVSAIFCTTSVFAKEAAKALATDIAKEAEKTIETPVAMASMIDKAQEAEKTSMTPIPNDAVVAELEASRRVLMEMKAPRDQHMAEAGELAKQVEARRSAILTENEEAAKLKADIAELDKVLEEKMQSLQAVFDADSELAALQVKMQAARDNFGKNQLKLREEIARQHRERRLAMQKAAQEKEAAEKTKMDDAAKTDDVEKENAAQ